MTSRHEVAPGATEDVVGREIGAQRFRTGRA